MEKSFCPHCGYNVTDSEETEEGIFCPKCRGDFWKSETIPASEIHQYEYRAEYNLMIKIN